jgi:nicotinate dehydrogenase subunit A
MRMHTITLHVNGQDHKVPLDDDGMPLLYALRDTLGLRGPKFGCGLGQCGACTVLLDGQAIRSCITPAAAATGTIITLEGLGSPEHPHPMQAAFIAEAAGQCAYCSNGMIMTATALLAQTPHPTDDDIRSALAGNLCRCGAHDRILRAVHRAAGG